MEDALAGLKVVEFTIAALGPLIGKCLAAYGACVVRVESSKRPCNLRLLGPFKDGVPGLDRSGTFADHNPNKYSISLDMTNSKGLEIAKKLVGWADVVIQNYTPGVMEKLGLGYEELQRIKPDLVVLGASILGQTGPHSRHPGLGTQVVGLIGLPFLTGWPDTPPLPVRGVSLSDVITPPFGLAALLAALLHKKRTGKGQYIDLTQLEACIHFLLPWFLDYQANERTFSRNGNTSPCMAPHGVFPCKGDDRWCALVVTSDKEWDSLCQALEAAVLRDDNRFTTLLGRKKHEEELNGLLASITKEWEAEALVRRLRQAGVIAGLVAEAKDMLEDAQLKHRDFYWWLNHPVLGLHPHLGASAQLSRTPAQPRHAAPCLGEHTEFVCREILGMDDQEFVISYNAGAFQ